MTDRIIEVRHGDRVEIEFIDRSLPRPQKRPSVRRTTVNDETRVLFTWPPEPEPERTLIDGAGREQAFVWKGTGGTVRATDYRNFAPVQNGSHVIYASPGKTSLLEDCTFADIRSQRDSSGFRTDANDHIIYPGADPGIILIRGCHLDASQLNGAAVHVYPASSPGAELVEISDTSIVVGDMNYWALALFGARKVILRNVAITGSVRTPESAERYGFRSLYGRVIECSSSTDLSMDNVTWNGRLLTTADV